MKRLVACAVAIAFLAAAGTPAWAREAKGKVKSWETTTRTITLEDGTQYVVTEKVKTIEKIKPGKTVKMNYDEQEGKNLVSVIEVVEAD